MKHLWTLLPALLAAASALGQTGRPLSISITNKAVLEPNFWPSNRLAMLASLSLDTVINGGVPNSGSALVDWSQLRNVPAGFADGTDDGGGGGGSGTVTSVDVAAPFYASAGPVTTSGTISLSLSNQLANKILAGPTSGGAAAPTYRDMVDADIPSAITRDSEAADAYQPLNSVLTTLTTLNGSALTNLNGTEIRSGTVAAARIDSAIATDAEVAAGYQPLNTNLTALASGTAMGLLLTNSASIGSPTVYLGSTNLGSALALKAPIASPALTGTPTAPTATAGDNSTQIATTAFVQASKTNFFIGTFAPAINQPGTNTTGYATLSVRANGFSVLEFDQTTEESAWGMASVPIGGSLASGITFVIRWTTTATSGDGRWGVQVMRLDTDIDSDSFDTATEVTTTTSGTSGIVNTTTVTVTNTDSIAAGEMFRFRIYRDTGDAADTITADIQLLGATIYCAQ